MDKMLKIYLDKYGINYTVYEHSAVFTVAQSKNVTNHIPGLHTKNLFLKDEKNNYYLICLPGVKRLNLKDLRSQLKVKELHFSSPEELKKELNLTPGSVSLFGMMYAKNTKLILDEEVWSADCVGFHPNINTATLVIDHSNLESFYNSLKCEKKILKL